MIKIPDAWLPNVGVAAIVTHWTGGARSWSTLDARHYHLGISHVAGSEPKLHRGVCSIADNVNLKDGSYAAHTRGFNARNGKAVIGVALCGMAGATQSPFNPGGHPITREQWEALADVVAQLAKFYKVPVDEKHVLQHGEVQKNLGIEQRGKWDICKLAFDPTAPPDIVCNDFRDMVKARLAGTATVPAPPATPEPVESEPWQVVVDGKLIGTGIMMGSEVYVPARKVLAAVGKPIVKHSDQIIEKKRFYIRTTE